MISQTILSNGDKNLRLIGAGAYGSVYGAHWKGRRVAVKELHVVEDDVHRTPDMQNEIEILKRLKCRHIIQFFGTEYHLGKLVIIMDFADGGSLAGAIDRRELADWSTRTRIYQEIARGLAYIHHEGIIHRDLKSMNVLLTYHKEVKLCDFGLAKIKAQSGLMSTTLKGTYRWMAPELFTLTPKYSFKSDMYALGMVMWEMAANCTMPFKGQTDNHTVMTFVRAGSREKLPFDTPAEYRIWVTRCWAESPDERPEAREMEGPDSILDIAETSGSLRSTVNLTENLTNNLLAADSPVSSGDTRVTTGATGHAVYDMEALRKRALSGDVEAQVVLASKYESGDGVDQSDVEAFQWYLRAAAQESMEAQYKIGFLFSHGRGAEKNTQAALSWTQLAAGRGHPAAQRALGRMYECGQGVAINHDEAMSLYRKSAEGGDKEAQSLLGTKYYDGIGVDRNYAEAAWWFQKSAKQGDATVQCNLGLMFHTGQGVQQDYDKAVSWYRKSAKQGNTTAQYNLGVMYSKGHGVAKNEVEAARWYLQAAEKGNATAQRSLGLIFSRGQGVDQDYNVAASWFKRAAEQGNTTAQCDLGAMYSKGLGVTQNFDEARGWYLKAAEQGNAGAQYNLGMMHENGRGVPKDKKVAIQWYKRAAIQEYEPALERVKELSGCCNNKCLIS
ncbi:hypothetical protein DFQ26_009676 [Actinomortierella ambigua]|nr:hypothetical protein DFQ26_009676 [Actinomortierella ambigua]